MHLLNFSNVVFARLWSAYRQIAAVIRENQESISIAILEDEVCAGTQFRAKNIVEECRLHEKAGRGKSHFN